jgi:hypothetical protein
MSPAARRRFFINRLMLVLGHSIAVEKGMLDVTHTHLFTFRFHQGVAQTIWLQNSLGTRNSGAIRYRTRKSFRRTCAPATEPRSLGVSKGLSPIESSVTRKRFADRRRFAAGNAVSDALKAELLESSAQGLIKAISTAPFLGCAVRVVILR